MKALLRDGTDLIGFIVRARVPMPKSTREYIDRCQQFRRAYIESHLSVLAPRPDRLRNETR